ncbi:DNA-binding protein SMUBP-2-like [Pollicipes pollicipes]|uniref:DNA-binding protein SMUBP-2-like n=1 Tax=Pollicipes pollicipes TaxID=41117 RepID=UPI0018854B7A|nr:DNA-binding protein SMUBP-2-like [Pollicipes pollicipes]
MTDGASRQGGAPEPVTCATLVTLHLRLLELEAQEQRGRERQRRLKNASPTEPRVVNTGRTPCSVTVTLKVPERVRRRSRRTLAALCVDKGGRVDVARLSGGATYPAVVSDVTSHLLTLVIRGHPGIAPGEVLAVTPKIGDPTIDWMQKALMRLASTTDGHVGRMRAALFAEEPLEKRRDTVEFALRQRRLAVIHGPPGTGKTTFLVEIILQHRRLGHRVLVCAPSNTAVDNLLERLWKAGASADLLRLGHPGRIRPSLHRFCLDRRVCMTSQPKVTSQTILRSATVVLGTLTGVYNDLLREVGNNPFDLTVIDECSQALEAACWVVAPYAAKLLLTGDHHQLPATILSKEAAHQGLALSLMERQVALHGDAAVRMLHTQYRMHELIQRWPSEAMYGGLLEAAPAVRRHRLSQLSGVRDTVETGPVLLLIDTAGCRPQETRHAKTGSRGNDGEAGILAARVVALLRDGLSAGGIGVITPYARQVELIGTRLRHLRLPVEVSSVDGFQGREREAVLLSLLVVVCDTTTVRADAFIASLVDHMVQHDTSEGAQEDQRSCDQALIELAGNLRLYHRGCRA